MSDIELQNVLVLGKEWIVIRHDLQVNSDLMNPFARLFETRKERYV